VLDPLTGAPAATVPPGGGKRTPGAASPPSPARGLAFLPSAAGTGAARLPLLVAADGGGEVRLLAPGGEEEGSPSSYALVGRLVAAPRPTALALHAPTARIAVVCEGAEASVWDLASRTQTFKAKGDKPDRLGMVAPAGGASVAFLPAADPGGRVFVAGTATGRVRLYDARHGARPAATVALSQKAVTALASPADAANPLAVWAGDGAGLLRCVDLGARRAEGVLKGATAAVTGAAVWPGAAASSSSPPLVASVGLDGFLRVHDGVRRRQVAGLYLKQPLAAVHWCPAAPGSGTVADAVEGEGGAPVPDRKRKKEKKDKAGKKKKRK
jgi:hypothetical protein